MLCKLLYVLSVCADFLLLLLTGKVAFDFCLRRCFYVKGLHAFFLRLELDVIIDCASVPLRVREHESWLLLNAFNRSFKDLEFRGIECLEVLLALVFGEIVEHFPLVYRKVKAASSSVLV